MMSMIESTVSEQLIHIYELMEERFGNLQWWPAETDEEIIIGAILVQNVSWANVETAIELLKAHDLCNFAKLLGADIEIIETCIRSTRFYKTKAKKLLAFSRYLNEYHDGSLDNLFAQPLSSLRAELLRIHGIGPETADDILLYAARKPTFVIDAYTRRIIERVGVFQCDYEYEAMRKWFLGYLPHDVPLLNQYHALLDAIGHHYCLPKAPRCTQCPLVSACLHGHACATESRTQQS